MNTTKMIEKLHQISADNNYLECNRNVSFAELNAVLSSDDSQQRIEALERRVDELEKTIQRWQDKTDCDVFDANGCPKEYKKDAPAVAKNCIGKDGYFEGHQWRDSHVFEGKMACNVCGIVKPEPKAVECKHEWTDKGFIKCKRCGIVEPSTNPVTASEPSKVIQCAPEAAKELREMGISVEPSKDNGQTHDQKDKVAISRMVAENWFKSWDNQYDGEPMSVEMGRLVDEIRKALENK